MVIDDSISLLRDELSFYDSFAEEELLSPTPGVFHLRLSINTAKSGFVIVTAVNINAQ